MRAEARLRELGIELPAAPQPIANYVPYVLAGDLLFLAGHGPRRGRNGRVGDDLTVEEGYAAAREVALNLLATMKAALGDLDRVERIVKVLGMVRCAPEFGQQPQVINGASDLFVDVFGDRGRHARSAVGMHALPNGIPVEIEMVVQVSP
jgi:enamine deaminase RidA (YjgF/YER057c/UK114 family)